MAENIKDQLSARHRSALEWFASRAGEEIAWPDPFNGMFLMQRAKGIHKPNELRHALSVRQSMGGPYDDSLKWPSEGVWALSYAQEGNDPDYFTNRALRDCLADGVPVGVVVQAVKAPLARYKVLGLGAVVGYEGGVFAIRPHGGPAARAEAAVAVSSPRDAFDTLNIEDARRREMRALAVRQGQPAFRRALFEAYGGRCAITGCGVAAVLEAAHIIPYLGERTNHVQNGLLLRSDIHALFDQKHLWIDPKTRAVGISSLLMETDYAALAGKPLRLPDKQDDWPSEGALLSQAPDPKGAPNVKSTVALPSASNAPGG